MKNNAGFQTIALTRIHESTTNPRSIFDESKLAELADFVPGHKMLRFVPLTVLLPRKRGAAWIRAAPLAERHITITAS
jgi:hypothetical protein